MKLMEVAEVHAGYLNREPIRAEENGAYCLIQARDVVPGVVRCSDVPIIHFEPDPSPRDRQLRDGDVVFMTRGTRNYAAVLIGVPERTLAAASFFVVRVLRADLDSIYLAWYLNRPQVQRYFEQNSGRGVHMPVVRRSVLEQLDIPLPSMATQKRIADLFHLMQEEQDLTTERMKKRAALMEAICLQAAEREGI